MKKRELTIEERQKIVTLHKMGLGYKKINEKLILSCVLSKKLFRNGNRAVPWPIN